MVADSYFLGGVLIFYSLIMFWVILSGAYEMYLLTKGKMEGHLTFYSMCLSPFVFLFIFGIGLIIKAYLH